MENLDKSRRRSFVDCRRKSLVFNQIFIDGCNENENLTPGFLSTKITIDEYLESLKKEKQQWKDVLLERKKWCKQSKDKSEFDPLVIKEEEVESFLKDEECNFLKCKPDYLKMLDDTKKYVDSKSYVDKYKKDVIKHYDEITEVIEMQKKMLVDKMCSDDLCEVCNTRKCKEPDHKFLLNRK